MAVLISDSDEGWREFERTERFLISMQETYFMAKKHGQVRSRDRSSSKVKRSDRWLLILVLLCFLGAFCISTFWK